MAAAAATTSTTRSRHVHRRRSPDPDPDHPDHHLADLSGQRSGAGRVVALDGLRGLAALVVLAYHVYHTTWPGLEHLHAPPLVRFALADAGVLAVDVFFVLSGYLVLGPLLAAAAGLRRRPSTARYVATRALRILPAWWVCLGVVLVVSNRALLARPGDLALLATLQHTFAQHLLRDVIAPAWTLHIEVWLYALGPLVAAGAASAAAGLAPASRRRVGMVLLVVLAAAAASAALQAFWLDPVRRPSPDIRVATFTAPLWLDRFLLGGALALLVRVRPPRRPALVALLGLLAVPTALAFLRADDPVASRLVTTAGIAAVVAGAAAAPTGGLLAARPLVWFGTISYGAYLWHLPLLHGALRLGLVPRDDPAATPLAILGLLVASSALGWASYAVVEQPALRRVPALAAALAHVGERLRALARGPAGLGGRASRLR